MESDDKNHVQAVESLKSDNAETGKEAGNNVSSAAAMDQPNDSTTNGDEEENFVDALDNLSLEHSYARRLPVDENVTKTNTASDENEEIVNSDAEIETCESSDVDSVSHEAQCSEDADGMTTEPLDDEDAAAESPADAGELVIDEAVLREKEALLTDEEKQSRRQEALRLKDLGNSQFAESRFEVAISTYTDALASCLLCHATDRAIIYGNRAAAKMRLDQNESAIADCTKALEYNPDYMKALLRRAELYEKTDKLDEALEDYTKALERDPSLHTARLACMRLPDKIKERNEKMKDEMLSKLKDLGNMILRPFGLSTNNFKLQQDPATGSYSVSFQQGQQQGQQQEPPPADS